MNLFCIVCGKQTVETYDGWCDDGEDYKCTSCGCTFNAANIDTEPNKTAEVKPVCITWADNQELNRKIGMLHDFSARMMERRIHDDRDFAAMLARTPFNPLDAVSKNAIDAGNYPCKFTCADVQGGAQ